MPAPRRLSPGNFSGDVLDRMPFPRQGAVDRRRSEWKAELGAACQARALALFVVPPKSPKLHGRVERSHRAFEEECSQCSGNDLTAATVQPALRAWETISNSARPHQALGYLTPAQWRADHENRVARNATRPELADALLAVLIQSYS